MDGLRILLPNLLYFLVVPASAFCFFCRYAAVPIKWYLCAAYTAFSALLTAAELRLSATGAAGLFMELLPLTITGAVLLRGNWPRSTVLAALVVSVLNVCGGVSQLLFYWALSAARPVWPVWESAFLYLDLVRETVRALLAACLLALVLKNFRESLACLTSAAACLLAVPLFYISLVERTVRDAVYGDTLILDSGLGLVAPAVAHGEMLVLQLFAAACLFLTLAAYRSMVRAWQDRETVRLLRQQAEVQETYIREARSRYEQTRSFRHDLQNHLSVLSELLRTGQAEQARCYLSRLEEAASGLSYPVHTGCAAADALLGSKLGAARQEGISVTCEARLPDRIPDIDWCILLSNGLDNAIRACGGVPPDRRFLRVTGKIQGNLYLLTVENGCPEGTPPPEEGVGLANIRAAAGRHGGAVHTNCGGGVFRLDVLLVISQQADGSSQQSP